MQFPILDFNEVTGESNKDDNLSKILEKLQEEYNELCLEITTGHPIYMAEEAQDVIQVLIRLFDFLEKKCNLDLEILNQLHNEKLKKRGWEAKGHIELYWYNYE